MWSIVVSKVTIWMVGGENREQKQRSVRNQICRLLCTSIVNRRGLAVLSFFDRWLRPGLDASKAHRRLPKEQNKGGYGENLKASSLLFKRGKSQMVVAEREKIEGGRVDAFNTRE